MTIPPNDDGNGNGSNGADHDGADDAAILDRLANYGDVLRDELAAASDDDERAKVIPIGVAAGEASTPRRSQRVLRVAAVVALVAVGMLGVRMLNSDDADVVVEMGDGSLVADEADTDVEAGDDLPGAVTEPSNTPTPQSTTTAAIGAAAETTPTPTLTPPPGETPIGTVTPGSIPSPTPTIHASTVPTPTVDGPAVSPTPTPTLHPTITATPVTPSADPGSGLSCAQGRLVGPDCIITTDPTTTTECPSRAGVFEEDGTCYEDVDRDESCLDPAGTGACLIQVPSLPARDECPNGTPVIATNSCRTSVPADHDCSAGALVSDRGRPTCRIERTPTTSDCPNGTRQGSGAVGCYEVVPATCGGDLLDGHRAGTCLRPAPITEELTCFGSWPDTGISADGDCVDMTFGDESCPADAIEHIGFTCTFWQPPPNDSTPITCPDGWYVVGHPVTNVDGCGRDEEVTVTCPSGYSPSGVECIRSVPPVTVKVCSLTNTTVDLPEECATEVPAECPAGLPPIADGCQREVAVEASCRANEEMDSGRCVRYADPTTSCPAGQELNVVSGGSDECIIETPMPRNPRLCPSTGGIVEIVGACYRSVGDAGRIEVARVPGDPECPSNYTLVAAVCERRVPAE